MKCATVRGACLRKRRIMIVPLLVSKTQKGSGRVSLDAAGGAPPGYTGGLCPIGKRGLPWAAEAGGCETPACEGLKVGCCGGAPCPGAGVSGGEAAAGVVAAAAVEGLDVCGAFGEGKVTSGGIMSGFAFSAKAAGSPQDIARKAQAVRSLGFNMLIFPLSHSNVRRQKMPSEHLLYL